MSGEGESKAFEVERRVRGHVPIPEGFRKVKEYGLIHDAYMKVDDETGQSERLRYGEIIFLEGNPKITKENPDKKGKYVWKNLVSQEFLELETIFGDPMMFIEQTGNAEAVVVRGSRITYSDAENRIVMTHDKVHRLGKFTEFEVMADLADMEREDAGKEVENFMSTLGIKKSEYVKDIYPFKILQLELLNEVYRTPVTCKKMSTRKMSTQYKASARTVDRLCGELEKLGWIYETKQGFWEPSIQQETPQPELQIEGMLAGPAELANALGVVNSYVLDIVTGARPLCPVAEIKKVAPYIQLEKLPVNLSGARMQPPKK